MVLSKERLYSLRDELDAIQSKSSHSADDLIRATEIADEITKAGREPDEKARKSVLAELGNPGEVAGVPHGTVSSVLQTKGWTLGTTATIEVETKALIDSTDNARPVRESGILREVEDARYVFPLLPIKDAGQATAVQVLKSSGRTLNADVQPVASTAAKPVTDSAAVLETVSMQRVATVSSYYPNAIVQLEEFRNLVDGDMRDAYRTALDEYVVGEIYAEAGTTADSGDDLFEQLRKGVTAVQALGFTPDLAVVSAADAETLDLSRSGGSTTDDGPFVLSPAPRDLASSPLWGLRVVVGVNAVEPIVMATGAVQLYIGAAEFSADSITEFDTNQSRFRLESPALAVVRRPEAIYLVGAS
jgi:hypothetical protein